MISPFRRILPDLLYQAHLKLNFAVKYSTVLYFYAMRKFFFILKNDKLLMVLIGFLDG